MKHFAVNERGKRKDIKGGMKQKHEMSTLRLYHALNNMITQNN